MVMRAKRAGKKLKLYCRERIDIYNASEASRENLKIEVSRAKRVENFFENFTLFPPILASSGQIIYFLSRIGQIIYFQYF